MGCQNLSKQQVKRNFFSCFFIVKCKIRYGLQKLVQTGNKLRLFPGWQLWGVRPPTPSSKLVMCVCMKKLSYSRPQIHTYVSWQFHELLWDRVECSCSSLADEMTFNLNLNWAALITTAKAKSRSQSQDWTCTPSRHTSWLSCMDEPRCVGQLPVN